MPPVVLVTGCTPGGIGHAIALEYSQRNCIVLATARRPQVLDYVSGFELSKNLEAGSIVGLQLDMTSSQSIENLVKEIESKLGRIDILVNNAGVSCCYPFIETPMENVRKIFETNVLGVIDLVQRVSPIMIRQKSGKILNVSSVSTRATLPWSGIYCASKGAIDQISQSLSMELGPFGIQVTNVFPGSISTNVMKSQLGGDLQQDSFYRDFWPGILKRRTHISPKSTTPEEFAVKVVEMSLKPKIPLEFYYGHLSTVCWFLNQLPQWLKHWILGHQFGIQKQ